MADKLLARAAEWPAGTKPALRLLLNGSVQVVDEVEDAPLLTITGHNGVNPAAILDRLATVPALYEALEEIVATPVRHPLDVGFRHGPITLKECADAIECMKAVALGAVKLARGEG